MGRKESNQTNKQTKQYSDSGEYYEYPYGFLSEDNEDLDDEYSDSESSPDSDIVEYYKFSYDDEEGKEEEEEEGNPLINQCRT